MKLCVIASPDALSDACSLTKSSCFVLGAHVAQSGTHKVHFDLAIRKGHVQGQWR